MTISFWRYAVFSRDAIAKLLATIGVLWLFMELMDFLSIYTKDRYSKFAIVPIVLFSLVYVIFSRRPVSRVQYKIPSKDYSIEVKIGDIFSEPGDVVISANTTFDTDISNGLISPQSLQGQLALRVFGGNTGQIDQQLALALEPVSGVNRADAPGKRMEYPIGTVAKVNAASKTYYFVAMARLNEHGTAKTSLRNIEDSLERVWDFAANRGELREIAVPLLGTGRGRIDLPRRKIIEKIAQSFADASRSRVFSNKLVVVVTPEDAVNFKINLFEVRDYLSRTLHV